jgi:hypothetical protein
MLGKNREDAPLCSTKEEVNNKTILYWVKSTEVLVSCMVNLLKFWSFYRKKSYFWYFWPMPPSEIQIGIDISPARLL